MEVLQGLRMQTGKRLWEAYHELLENRLPCLPLDLEVARVFASASALMHKKGMKRPELDLIIAATAICHNLTLVTCNYCDFACIPELKVEDWS